MSIKFAGLLALALSLGAAQMASATDLPVKAPVHKAPAADPTNSWTGCYIGGNVGRIRGANSTDTFPSGTWFTGATAAEQSALSRSAESNGSGISGGVQIGCNYEAKNWVWSVEADFQRTSLDESSTVLVPATGTFLASNHTVTTA